MSTTQINLAETPDFDLGGLRVSAARRRVAINGSGRELEPRVAQVLVALASVRPEVVSRDRLIDQCWDGRIVGDDALNRCIVALRHLAKEFSPEPFEIETVPRVGYRLVEHGGSRPPAYRRRTLQRGAVASLLVVLAIVALGWAFGLPRLWSDRRAPASIAVLPFRNLSAGDPYFAQGVGEEITGQLAREPAFQVAGSTSSSQAAKSGDLREVAQRLNVDFLVEGSVRRQGDQVRVNAGLLRAKDGVRLWSGTFDGTLNDMLKIQSAIGEAVANGLKRNLAFSTANTTRSVNGEAYALYLNARGILRTQYPQAGQDAVSLLRESVRLDPGFAPSWASLAEALQLDAKSKGAEQMIAILPQARSAVDRALQIDPNLAQAHAILAKLIGEDRPEAVPHLRRAAELDPRSGEGLIWLATAHNVSGEFADGLGSFRRAHAADPLWPFPLRALVDVTAIMGDRRGAETVIRNGFSGDPVTQDFALARVAWLFGDFSEAARRWSKLADGTSRWSAPSRTSLQDALFTLGLSKAWPSRPPLSSLEHARYPPRLWGTPRLSAADWRTRNRSPAAALIYHDENIVAAKRMLASGRARELVATYDSPTGLLGIKRGAPLGVCYIQSAALVALALRDVGRSDEAGALLRQADVLLRSEYRRGPVPTWFDGDAAAVWALQGKSGEAVNALDRSLRRGWVHAGRTDLASLEEEPVFRTLRDDPGFRAMVAKYGAYYAKEREETVRALKNAAA